MAAPFAATISIWLPEPQAVTAPKQLNPLPNGRDRKVTMHAMGAAAEAAYGTADGVMSVSSLCTLHLHPDGQCPPT
jgi:hypothetical protein